MANIFISYRREDASGHAGRLCDRLNSLFGGESVFMDVEDIRPGEDFARAIHERVAGCDLVLAVIGPRWLESLLERRDDHDDFVRRELTAALERKIAVVPVLVGGARMPRPGDLPPGLEPLSFLNAIEISDTRFDEDVSRLSSFLRDPTGRRHRGLRRWWPALAAMAAALAGMAIYLALRPGATDIGGKWVAKMLKSGQRPFQIQLTFQASGGSLTGTVEYPTGTGVIHDGKMSGRRLSFSTTHVSDVGGERVTIRYEGTVAGDEIRLRSTDDFGEANGTAKRVRAASTP